jgi:flagellar operon protein
VARIQDILNPLLPVQGTETSKKQSLPRTPGQPSFGSVLDQALGEVTISKHARQRLEDRNIQLDPADLSALGQAVSKAAEKGSRDSLILLRNLALIVHVPNRTVVTAIENFEGKENIFTNIDSTVIASQNS